MLCVSAASGQLVNTGFESWETSGSNIRPSGWDMYYSNFALNGDNSSICWQVSPAIEGSYSLRVSVWYYYTKSLAHQKAPVTTRPATLNGTYRYIDNSVAYMGGLAEPDTAMVWVILTRWNTTTLHADTVGYGHQHLFATTTDASFSCPVTYSSIDMPDSVTVILDPSIVKRYLSVDGYMTSNADGYGSSLTVDRISLDGNVTEINNIHVSGIAVYPNPATDYITVEPGDAHHYIITVMDVTGKVMKSERVGGGHTRVQVQDLPSGMYLMKMTDLENHIKGRTRFVKQ